MKHLKTFEGWEMLVPKEEHFGGITKEFIDDMFIDLSDDGYRLSTYLDKRSISSVDKEMGKMVISSIPYIWVRCDKQTNIGLDTIAPFKPSDEMKEYINSEEFKEIIEIANDRLKDFEWYVSNTMVQGNQIRIFMHRIEDKKYVV